MDPPRTWRIGLVLTSVALAWGTYQFLERPIRFPKMESPRLAWWLATPMAVVGLSSIFFYLQNYFDIYNPNNHVVVQDGALGSNEFLSYYRKNLFPCGTRTVETDRFLDSCIKSKNSDHFDIAIVGDSHAGHLLAGLAKSLPEYNVVFLGPKPPAWIDTLPSINNREYEEIYRSVLADSSIKTVIISAFWDQIISLGEIPPGSSIKKELSETIGALTSHGKRVWVADDVPFFPFPPVHCKYSREISPRQTCEISKDDFYRRRQKYLPEIDAAVSEFKNASLLKITHYFCDATTCSMLRNGAFVFRDNNHLNVDGSLYLGARILHDYPQLAN
jgi:hypothetical protein